MKVNENLLVTAMEECAEVQQAISKCLRFGADNYRPDLLNTNKFDVVYEYLQLTAMIEKLQSEGILPVVDVNDAIMIKAEKLDNVKKYQKVSEECGTLDVDW